MIAATGIPPMGDYWKLEDGKAIRVHRVPRLALFTPTVRTTYPATEKDTDPYYHQIGPMRTTRYKFVEDKTKTMNELVELERPLDPGTTT